ncbi:MAG: sensor domain-containing diguanylate cyclase [Leptolyngbya sp. SIO1D8]|nr:sensor domain-containing diguanylate cyclase [Leptolyngbya sp. SIO1D8]
MSAPGYFIDWSQLASELDLEVIANMNSLVPEKLGYPSSSFAELVAPLNRDTCQQVIHQIKQQLQVVNQTLAMLEGQTFDVILQDMLQACAFKVGEMLHADRTTVFLADKGRQELWSTVAKTDEPHANFEIRLPWDKGIAGEVARTQKTVNVPFDFYDDPRSEAAKQFDLKTGYRTYTLLVLPVLDSQGELVAVIELLNKCHPDVPASLPLSERIDLDGFNTTDAINFFEFSDVIRLILESSRAFYLAARRQKTATVLVKATQALNHSDPTLDNTLQRVMKEAQNLLEADRSTIWLLDPERNALRARLLSAEGVLEEIWVPVGEGYVGQVAETGMILNIPCDLYSRSDSTTARCIDKQSGYRTYSLLCMPVFDTAGTLIAVTQIVNKYRTGVPRKIGVANLDDQNIPDCFQASFNDDDEFFMLAFNIHAGVAIERALMYESLEVKVIARTQELQLKNQQLQQQIEERLKAEQALSKLNKQLKIITRVDALTQVANRRCFDEHFEIEWRRMRRSQSPLSLILCDIDFFKRYNDHYGHPAGDECLKQVAAAMSREVKRSGDLLARYGGEEFVVVLPNTNSEGALYVAEFLRQAVLDLALPHSDSEVDNIVTLSLGTVTCVPQPPHSRSDLLKKADEALYEAKKQGRNRIQVGNAF